jgi:proteasome activator subunit 4
MVLSKMDHSNSPSKLYGAVPGAPIPDDILNDGDRYMEKLKVYAKSLPYSIEPYSKMMEALDFIILRLTQAVHARDDVGLIQWDSMLT